MEFLKAARARRVDRFIIQITVKIGHLVGLRGGAASGRRDESQRTDKNQNEGDHAAAAPRRFNASGPRS